MSTVVPIATRLAQSALESAPDAIVISDERGCILFTNRQVEALFGYAPGEIAGRAIEELLPQRFRALHLEHRSRFALRPCRRPMGAGLDLYALRKDGTEFPVEISLSPVEDGDRLLGAAAIREVSENRRIESEMLAAREAADRANLAKSRFLATASHDIRQPLQTLALLNGTLRRIASDTLVGEVLLQQEQAIGSMLRLVNALLDISKLEAGVIRPQAADFTVASLFEELRREFESLAADKGLALEIKPLAGSIRSDPALVRQILRNLLSNAVKYTLDGSVALLARVDGPAVQIEVRDTGIGIPEDQIAHIFDEFYQVPRGPHAVREGYGLGLSIVNRLVGLLALELDVRSQLGRGSSFLLRLPAGAAAAPDTVSGTAPAVTRSRGRRVLLVEDDSGVRAAMQLLLGAEGYAVVGAASAEEALRIAARDPARFDLLISDYHLGGGHSGLDIIDSLRTRYGRDLKIILMSGDTSSAMQELRQDGRLRVASKPLSAEQLLALSDELLAQRETSAS